MKTMSAFTLIELLIVVAIIAVLAAIAVPNFLEAQTRAKISRVKGDFATIATAMESYCVDSGHYPTNGRSVVALSTPLAYVTTTPLWDPFAPTTDPDVNASGYGYMNFWEPGASEFFVFPVLPGAAGLAVKDCAWLLVSRGPDGFLESQDKATRAFTPETIRAAVLEMATGDYVYDPTNGTASEGDVPRTRKGELTRALAPM
ncbi:MAG: prepilin-type N-terminal cleavage/methylation domain-containing protein [Candidatus Sumerlaeia bacterium]|nr:prepilin-type N-terminal cleavage/methylation domain-containing protein [Candidatus Sumerlaeia bacterium]